MKQFLIHVQDDGSAQIFPAADAPTGVPVTGLPPNAGKFIQPPYGPFSSAAVSATFDGSQNYQETKVQQLAEGVPYIIQLSLTDADGTDGKNLTTIEFSDAGPARAFRVVSVSDTPGDFGTGVQWVSQQPSNSNSASVSIGPDGRGAIVKLTSGVKYINVLNVGGSGGVMVKYNHG